MPGSSREKGKHMYDFKPPYFGSAYYPEAWDRSQIDEDLDLMVSHGLNAVRIAEFAWSNMEPEDGKFDFSLFREVVDKCRARGISVIMCTPSATPPSWMEHRYPEIMLQPNGMHPCTHGSRRVSCPTNPRYRAYCRRIVEEMAKEFGNDENIIGWQIDNEITVIARGEGCACPSCTAAWHDWLRRRYGDVKALNDAWGNYTWSMDFSSIDEVDTPHPTHAFHPSHRMAWAAFENDMYADFCNEQIDILHRYTKAPVGTDMMPTQQFDFEEANEKTDILEINHYSGPAFFSLYGDFLRNMKNRPFWVTETSACWNGGNQPNAPRRKGFCAANSLFPFALGGEANFYWLFRSHYAGWEQMHGSVVDSWGREMQMADEIREVAHSLDKLRPMLEGTRPVQSGIAVEYAAKPHYLQMYIPMTNSPCDYRSYIMNNVHAPLVAAHYRPDVIHAGTDLSPYRVLITAQHYTIEESGFADRILPWVENGGTWVVGPLSDVLTPEGRKYKNAPYGHLEDWANVRRAFYMPAPRKEDWVARDIAMPPLTLLVGEGGETYTTIPVTYDALVPGEGVKTLATYAEGGDDYLPGYAAITETRVGRGRILLLGTQLDAESYGRFIGKVLAECGIAPLADGSPNVQNSLLDGAYGKVFTAFECTGRAAGSTALPFGGSDILTGKTYRAGERVELPPYGYLFLHEEK